MKGITVLYEDSRLLVLNKPAGLPVQGGAGVDLSLDSLLAESCKPRPLLVHRLDKDTSGVIVTAKTRESAAVCSALFAGHQFADHQTEGCYSDNSLQKTYLALCSGILDERGNIDETLLIKGRKLAARTSYTRLAGLQDMSFCLSLVELKPVTGRMHQIRRHLAKSGYPVLGDDKYGDFTLNKKLKKSLGLKRLLLHASSVYLPPSLINGGLEITAPLPDYFLDLLKKTGIDKGWTRSNPSTKLTQLLGQPSCTIRLPS